MDSDVPYLCNFFYYSLHYPRRQEHNGPSRVSVPKHLNSRNMGTWATSLIFMTNLQDESSCLRRSITLSVTPHLVRLPHLPSAVALRCHLRTVSSMTDRHKLPRWSLLHFFAQKPPHSYFDKFPTNKEKLILKISTKRLLDTLNLRKKY